MAAKKLIEEESHNQGWYRIHAIRCMTGSKRLIPQVTASLQAVCHSGNIYISTITIYILLYINKCKDISLYKADVKEIYLILNHLYGIIIDRETGTLYVWTLGTYMWTHKMGLAQSVRTTSKMCTLTTL